MILRRQRMVDFAEAASTVPTQKAPIPASGFPAVLDDHERSVVLPFLPAAQARQRHDTDAEADRSRTLLRLSFVIVVLVPTIIAGVYFFVIAADQYVAEFRFSLRTAEQPRLESLGLFGGTAPQLPAAIESHVVAQYIVSRAMVDELGKTVALRSLFNPPEADWWARLSPTASVERLVEYWQREVDAFYDPANGTTTVRVRAFSPRDALQLAQAIVAGAERLVNELSTRARHDTVHRAEEELAAAETRLRTALAQIRDFRDREGMIDPGKSADAIAGLTARLREELAQANAQLATLTAYMRDDAPPVKVLKARIRSLEEQRRAAAQKLTAASGQDDRGGAGARNDAPALSRTLSSYEQLESDRKFAETAYQHALSALDRARADADRQQVYIASFVPPSLPEEALYPRRWRSTAIVAVVAFALWAIGSLIAQSVQDHF